MRTPASDPDTRCAARCCIKLARVLAWGMVVIAAAGCGERRTRGPVREVAPVDVDALPTWSAARRAGALRYLAQRRAELRRAWNSALAPSHSHALGREERDDLDAAWRRLEDAYRRATLASPSAWDSARDALVEAYEDFERQLTAFGVT